VNDVSYIIRPIIALNTTTPRQHLALSYSPGFIFYTPSNGLNQSNQSLSAAYRYRLSPHISVSAQDNFAKSSSVFGQGDSLPGGPISGSPQPSQVVAPYAEQINNFLNGGVTYQYSLNGMLGAAGNFGTFDYPNQTAATNLYNSNNAGGSAYWGGRLSERQYIGMRYQFERNLVLPPSGQTGRSEALTHAFDPFYTVFLNQRFSISVSAGPQYVIASQTGVPGTSKSWGPSVIAGFGLQGQRVSLAGSFLRTVASGTGLIGTYETTVGMANLHWTPSKRWSVTARSHYQIQKDAVPADLTSNQGGHTLDNGATVGRSIGERLGLEFGYDRLHQSYGAIPTISPNNNHEFVSISYSITRPLGR
jgi:hypothetical protein